MSDEALLGPARYDWSRLSSLQVGRYSEYFVKMEFTLFGFDVYSSEVDDQGIDFVVRRDPERYYDIQVKSVRQKKVGKGYTYVFLPKHTFDRGRTNLFAALVLLPELQPPVLHLVPANAWQQPDALFVDRPYGEPGQTSKPEWGLNLSARNLPLLQPHEFQHAVQRL